MRTEFCLVAAKRAAAMLAVRGTAEYGRAVQFHERFFYAMLATTNYVRRCIPGPA